MRWIDDSHDCCSLLRSPLLLLSLHPSIHHLSAVLSFPSVHHCPCYTIKCLRTHPSLFPSLFHSISLLHSLFSSLAIICLLTPPSCLSACLSLQGSHSLPHIQCHDDAIRAGRHCRNKIGFLGHFTAIFVFTACFRVEKKQVDFHRLLQDGDSELMY